FFQFFFRHFRSTLQAECISRAKCQVVGGVLVKKSVVERNAGLGNRGWIRNEGNFTQVLGSFVCFDQVFERFFAFASFHINNFSVCEMEFHILNRCTSIAQWLRADDYSVYTVTVRSSEDLFCRHVGHEAFAACVQAASTFPKVVFRQSNSQVCAWCSVVKGSELCFVQFICFFIL